MNWIKQILDQAQTQGFYGKIEINFNGGVIININVQESLKPPQEWRGGLVGQLLKQPK